MNMLIPILLNLLFGLLTSHLAQKRGRDGTTWFVVGILLGIFGLALLFLLPPASKQELIGPKNVVNSGEEESFSSWEGNSSSHHSEPTQEEISSISALSEMEMLRQLDWYYMDRQHNQEGPIAYEDLRLAYKSERATDETFVWSEGMKDWKRIRDLHHILDDFISPQTN